MLFPVKRAGCLVAAGDHAAKIFALIVVERPSIAMVGGIMKLLVAQINPTPGDLSGNTAKIISAIQQARQNNVDLILFPTETLQQESAKQ